MTERSSLRKPKLYFDTAASPSHVTFDDGKNQRRNLPWMHYAEARWDYAEPDTIKIEIGDWRVVVRGHNLAPLFLAIEEHALARIRAQPELAADREHELDTFAVEIRFTKAAPDPFGRKPPQQLEFETG
jgi:hypothetical protein